MKQTAVERLVEQICGNHTSKWQKEIQQAKAMKKEQIIDAHLFGLVRPLEMEATKQADEYYNETLKKKM